MIDNHISALLSSFLLTVHRNYEESHYATWLSQTIFIVPTNILFDLTKAKHNFCYEKFCFYFMTECYQT